MSTNNITDLGLEIKNAIKQLGLNQTFVAKKMDLPKQSINRIEFRKTFDLAFLQNLKQATGLDYTNYVFNAKHKKYVPLQDSTNSVEEPMAICGNAIQMTLSIMVHGNPEEVNKMTEFIMAIKNEATRLGFAFK